MAPLIAVEVQWIEQERKFVDEQLEAIEDGEQVRVRSACGATTVLRFEPGSWMQRAIPIQACGQYGQANLA